MLYDLHCPGLISKVKNRICKQFGIYYPIIAAHKHHRQDACGLEVLGNEVLSEEEDISHEKEENPVILVVDSDDNHAPVINI